MKKTNKQPGFTTVELLVTLFVAAAFLMSGYQLYAMIIKNNGEASARAKAVSLAYKYLQRYKADDISVPKICAEATLTSPFLTDIDKAGLSNPSISIFINCPYSTASDSTRSISKLTVTVSYNYAGTPQQVTNATYVNKQ